MSLLTIAALAIASSEARGQWVQDGVPVGSTGMLQVQDGSRVAPDGLGGSFVAWREERLNTSTAEDIYLQHVLHNGQLDPAWPVSGLPVALVQNIQSPTHLVPDGTGGAIVVWVDGRNSSNDIFALRVDALGQRSPGWNVNGNPICIAEGSQEFTTACPDGSGGAYIAWDDSRDGTPRARLTHILEDGTIASGWETNGTLLTDYPGASGIRVLLEVSDGCLVVWADGRGRTSLGVNLFATRLSATGDRHPSWPADGTPILGSGSAIMQVLGVSDGNGGAFIGWVDNRLGVPTQHPDFWDIYAQHVLADGTLDTRWAPNGVPVCNAPDTQYEFGMAEDGAGGVLFDWDDYRQQFWQVYGLRMSEAGSAVPGWPGNGKPLVASTVTKFQPKIVGDMNGGFYAFWVEYPQGNSGPIVGQHMLGDGTMAWGGAGLVIAQEPPDGDIDNPKVASDGQGGALVSYERSDPEPWQRIYAVRIANDGPVPTLLSLADYDVGPGRVHLRWQASDAASMTATVERSADGEVWSLLGNARLDGRDLLIYEDVSVPPGRFAYRLQYIQSGTTRASDLVWIDVPSSYAFSLEGFRPNPALSAASIVFSLPDAEPTTLQLYDVGGRKIFSQEVGSLGPGSHVIPLAQARLGSGMYWLRLMRRDGTLTAKGIVAR